MPNDLKLHKSRVLASLPEIKNNTAFERAEVAKQLQIGVLLEMVDVTLSGTKNIVIDTPYGKFSATNKLNLAVGDQISIFMQSKGDVIEGKILRIDKGDAGGVVNQHLYHNMSSEMNATPEPKFGHMSQLQSQLASTESLSLLPLKEQGAMPIEQQKVTIDDYKTIVKIMNTNQLLSKSPQEVIGRIAYLDLNKIHPNSQLFKILLPYVQNDNKHLQIPVVLRAYTTYTYAGDIEGRALPQTFIGVVVEQMTGSQLMAQQGNRQYSFAEQLATTTGDQHIIQQNEGDKPHVVRNSSTSDSVVSKQLIKTDFGIIRLNGNNNLPLGQEIMFEIVSVNNQDLHAILAHNIQNMITSIDQHLPGITSAIADIFTAQMIARMVTKPASKNRAVKDMRTNVKSARLHALHAHSQISQLKEQSQRPNQPALENLELDGKLTFNNQPAIKNIINQYQEIKESMNISPKTAVGLGQWFAVLIPFSINDNLEEYTVQFKRDEQQNLRFLIDVTLASNPMQLEGIVILTNNSDLKSFNMIIRTKNQMTPMLEQQIKETYTTCRDVAGIEGALTIEQNNQFKNHSLS